MSSYIRLYLTKTIYPHP